MKGIAGRVEEWLIRRIRKDEEPLRIQILSDLHIEFASFDFEVVEADVLVLAGDVHTKDRGCQFAARCAEMLPTVYVAGNHEFYGAAIPKLYESLAALAAPPNLHFLQNSQAIIHGVRFSGCTLWTDFGSLGDGSREVSMLVSRTEMNDYKKIRVSPDYRKLTPTIVYSHFRRSYAWLEGNASNSV